MFSPTLSVPLWLVFVSCLVWFLSSESYPNIMEKLYITELYNQISLVKSLVKCLVVWKISVPL